MADNIYQAVIPRILASGLMALRNNVIAPMLVSLDYSDEATQRGRTIDVPIPAIRQVRDVVSSSIKSQDDSEGSALTYRKITMDQWKTADFNLSDRDMKEVMENSVFPMQASEAIAAIAQEMNDYVLNQMYPNFYGFVGPASFGDHGGAFKTDTKAATRASSILKYHRTPMNEAWRFLIDPTVEANATNQRAFQDYSWNYDIQGIRDGTIGRKFGFNFFCIQDMPKHTTGMGTGWLVNGAVAKGKTDAVGDGSVISTTIQVDSGSTPANAIKGDLFEFENEDVPHAEDKFYVVTENQSGANLKFYPAPRSAIADNTKIIPVPTHTCNLAFHRSAYAFVVRPFMNEGAGLGNTITSSRDPLTNIPIRLEVSRENKQVRFSFDVLYGGGIIRPEYGVRVAS